MNNLDGIVNDLFVNYNETCNKFFASLLREEKNSWAAGGETASLGKRAELGCSVRKDIGSTRLLKERVAQFFEQYLNENGIFAEPLLSQLIPSLLKELLAESVGLFITLDAFQQLVQNIEKLSVYRLLTEVVKSKNAPAQELLELLMRCQAHLDLFRGAQDLLGALASALQDQAMNQYFWYIISCPSFAPRLRLATPSVIYRCVVAHLLEQEENAIRGNMPCRLEGSNAEGLLDYFSNLDGDSCNRYVKEKLIAQARLYQIMLGFGDKFAGIRFWDIWKFVIDGEMQEAGPYIFENELGYIVATLNAFSYALQCETHTPSSYVTINELCGWNVHELHFSGEALPAKLRVDQSVYYTLTGLESDFQGYLDLFERSCEKSRTFVLCKGEGKRPDGSVDLQPVQTLEEAMQSERIYLDFRPLSKEQNLALMQYVFGYFVAMFSGNSKHWFYRLLAYAWLARELGLNHHFEDCNRRSTILLLYAFIAQDPELPMIQLYDPSILDCNGPGKLLSILVSSMLMDDRNKREALEFIQAEFSATRWADIHPTNYALDRKSLLQINQKKTRRHNLFS